MAEGMNITDTLIFEVKINDGGNGGKTAEKEKKDVDALVTSIAGLQQANRKLNAEKRLLDTQTEEGRKKIVALNGEIDKNNKIIKENSSSLEKQRLNIGNYSSALDRLVPGLGGAVQGIGGMTKASYAFIATGIGAIIAAIGIALGALVTFLKNSTTGMDFLEDAGAAVSAIFTVLIDRVTKFVGGFIKIINGDFVGGVKDIAAATTGLGDELKNAVGEAQRLAAAIRDLEDAEINYTVAAAETENQIKRLLLQAKNRTLAEKERIALIDEAIGKERELNAAHIENAKKQLQIDNDTLNQRLKLSRQANETEIGFGKRLLAELQKDGAIQADEQRDKIKNSIVALAQAQGESIGIIEKSMNQRDALEDAASAKRDKDINDLATKLHDNYQKQLDDQKQQNDQMAELRALDGEDYSKNLDKQLEKMAENNRKTVAAEKDKGAKLIIVDRSIADIRKQNENEVLKTITFTSGAIANLFRQNSLAFKVLATGRAIANTWLGVTEVLSSKSVLPEPAASIFRGLSIAGVIATGLKSVGEINNVKFGQGGPVVVRKFADGGDAQWAKRGTFKGPSHAQGGIDFTSTDGQRINVEGDENFYVLKKSASREINRLSDLNVRHGGRSWAPYGTYAPRQYALGGQVQPAYSIFSNNSETERIVKTLMANMPPVYVVAQDVAEVNNTSDSIKSRATVI